MITCNRMIVFICHNLMWYLMLEGIVAVSIYDGYNTELSEDTAVGAEASVDRDEKFLFTVLRFPNTMCETNKGMGLCYTAAQCTEFEGTDIGPCARGYGTCCSITVSGCGRRIIHNNTLITSDSYPLSFNRDLVCTFKVAFDNDICQIRYDFEAMKLVVPSKFGVCENDHLVFKEDTKSKYFCGTAPKDYHWYVETAGLKSPHTVTITTDKTSFFRNYAIRVSYITCMQGVPTKCGQYYTGLSGQFISFNYGNGYYLAGLEYSICFRKEKGYCTYTLFPQSDLQYIGGKDTLRLPVGEQIALTGTNVLPNTNLVCANEDIRQKAMYFTQIVCDYPPSFTSMNREASFFVYVETLVDSGRANVNHNPVPALKTRSGFNFKWQHNECEEY